MSTTRSSSGPRATASTGATSGTRETQLFRDDMSALRVLPPQDYLGATEAIDEVVEVVEKLLASGAAYVVDDAESPGRVLPGRRGAASSATSPTTTATP